MNERERWIVYPLLFLALGASLRDKIIKTTESQRIKCQGLMVVDKDDRPLLILGAEQFPEVTVARDMLQVDEIKSKVLASSQITASVMASSRHESEVLVANLVEANQYVVNEGKKGVLQLNAQNGKAVAQLLGWLSNFAQQVEAFQQRNNRPTHHEAPPGTPPGATLPDLAEPVAP